MKKLYIAVFLLAGIHTYAQSDTDPVHMFCYFKNNSKDGLHLAYSKDGYTWQPLFNDSAVLQPAAGKDKLMRDPCIVKGGDGKYHMVWTVSWGEKGIGYASSPDLLHWSSQQYLPVMEHEAGALNAWAPEINYDAKKAQYIIYWATTIPGRFPETDSSGDGNNNHRIYYTRTKDFKTFTKAAILYDGGFNVIDATIQQDGARYIMFLKNETKRPVAEKNIRIATSKDLYKGYSAASQPITGNYWAEGPTAFKKDGAWIVYFDKYTEHKYGAVTSTNLKTWTDISDKIKVPPGLRHGTIFTISQKEFRKYFQ